jgi:hypothetical protein
MRVQMSPSFCFMPPDSWPAGRARKALRRVTSNSRSLRSRSSSGGTMRRRGEEVDVLFNGQRGVEVQAQALGHEADGAFDLLGLTLGVDESAQHLDLAFFVAQHPGNHLHEAALARAVGADQAVDLGRA